MKQRDFLFLLVSICIVVFAWIAFTIVHNSQSSTISTATAEIIAPIAPNFDTATLNKLAKRPQVTPAFTISAVPTVSIVPNPTPTPLPPLDVIASNSAQPAASQEGSLR